MCWYYDTEFSQKCVVEFCIRVDVWIRPKVEQIIMYNMSRE